MTTTFGPFSLVRPCKVLLTDLRIFNFVPGFLEVICCAFCHFEPGQSRNFSGAASAGKTLSQFLRFTKPPLLFCHFRDGNTHFYLLSSSLNKRRGVDW